AAGRPDDYGVVDFAFLHTSARSAVLDADLDDITNAGIAALGAAQHLDAHHRARTGVIGHVEPALHLNHLRFSLQLRPPSSCFGRQTSFGTRPGQIGAPKGRSGEKGGILWIKRRHGKGYQISPLAFSTSCTTFQALVLDMGRVSSIKTRSPGWNSFFSSCA